MIPSGISRGPQGRANVPLWLVGVGGVLAVVAIYLIVGLFMMGSTPAVTEVSEELPVTVQ